MNKVRQILKTKDGHVWQVSRETSVLDVLKLMSDKQIGSVMVVDEGKVAGIFTERDFARKVGVQDVKPSAVRVGDVMTRDLITVGMDNSVNECMTLITENRIRHLPVLEEGQLIGIVSIGDVVKDIIEELQFIVRQLENYVGYFR